MRAESEKRATIASLLKSWGWGWGTGFGEERERRAIVSLLFSWPAWLVCFQGILVGAGGWDDGMSRRKEGWRRSSIWPIGDECQRESRDHSMWSATELGMRVGHWTWRNGGRGEELQLAYTSLARGACGHQKCDGSVRRWLSWHRLLGKHKVLPALRTFEVCRAYLFPVCCKV